MRLLSSWHPVPLQNPGPKWLGLLLAVLLGAGTAAWAQSTPPPGPERVAVMDMRGVGADDAEREAITDRLREVLLKTGRFTMVDRSQMKAILNEQALQQAACTEAACAVEAGRILGVRKIVAGKIVKFGQDRWQISALMVDVETAVTVRADSVRFQGDIFGLLDTQVTLLGRRLVPEAAVAVAAAPVAAGQAALAPSTPAPAPPRMIPLPSGPGLARLQGSWSAGPPMQIGRARHAAVAVGGHVFVFGGEGDRGDALDSVERLDVAAGRWSPAAPLPEARSAVAAERFAGQVYVLGGRGANGVLARVDVYDPGADRWHPGPALPSAREGVLALVAGERLYVIGGLDGNGRGLREVLTLQAGETRWQSATPMRQPRAFATSQVVDGNLYVQGGRRGSGGLASLLGSALVKTGEAFDPATGRWRDLPEPPQALTGMTSALIGRKLYLFGGHSGSIAIMTPQGRQEVFDVDKETWSAGDSMPTGRAEHATVVLPDRVLLIGGKPRQYRTVSELR